jgi:hypothetical protein
LHPPQENDTRNCFLSPSFPRDFVHLLHRGQLGHLQLHPGYKFFMKELVASCTKQCRSSRDATEMKKYNNNCMEQLNLHTENKESSANVCDSWQQILQRRSSNCRLIIADRVWIQGGGKRKGAAEWI